MDEFFENVMVNARRSRDVRINRLTLLSKLRELLFLQVADISLLQ